ncbi:MAG: PIN domain-containing protein [Armatimonadetes bacterium]|nr:PIN domain-containing protein [Armatimonadota bacterium]
MSVEFVDTNILVYAYDNTGGPRHVQARDLITRLWKSGDGALSVQVLKEFYAVVTRKISNPLSPTQARERLRNLSLWRVDIHSASDIVSASELSELHTISFWDALIVQSACKLGATRLWSEDLQTGRRFGDTEICTPFT